MVVTTRSRRGATTPGLEPEELTTAHMASATNSLTTPKPADRRAPGHKREPTGHMGIPGAFSQSPIPQEPEPSSDEQEEDWVSDEVTEAAEECIEDVQNSQDESCHSGESIDSVAGNPTGACHPEVAEEPANRLSRTRRSQHAWTTGSPTSNLSVHASGSGRTNTPPTPSFVAEAEATARHGGRTTTPFHTPRRKARASPVDSIQGSIQGPKYFTNAITVQYGEIHDKEKLEGGSDETLRQTKTKDKPKTKAQQRAEDMAHMREIIKNNRRLKRFKAMLPDIIPNNKSLLDEISELMPEAVSGDEFEIYDWEAKGTDLPLSKTPSTRDMSIKDEAPQLIIEPPTYLEKGKWVCDEEHNARMMNKQAKSAKAPHHLTKRARPSMGITIDEICPAKRNPKVATSPDKTNDLRASISALPAGGYFVDRMKARYDTSGTLRKTPKRETVSSESEESPDSSDTVDSETSSEDEHKKHKREIQKLKKKLRKSRKQKVSIKEPTPYKGEDNLDSFEKWDYETELWIRAHKLGNKSAVEYIGSFLGDKALQWYMDFVAPDPEKYTIDLIKMGLFSYCFPADIKARLRREFKYARQNNQKFIDYMRTLRRYQRRLPDISDQQICHKLWETVHLYMKVKWIEAGFNSESTSLETLCETAERFEAAEDAKNRQANSQNKNRKSGNAKYKGQSKGPDETKQTEAKQKGESSKNKPDSKKNNGKSKDRKKETKTKLKLSKEERDQLRAENKCYVCKEVGHTMKDCPTANTAKPTGLYSSALQYAKIEELRKEREISYIPVASVRLFGSPSISETPSEEPTAGECLLSEVLDQIMPYSRIVVADDELLRITNVNEDVIEITYRDIGKEAKELYLKRAKRRAHTSQENNPMMVLVSDPEDKEEVWSAIEWEELDTDEPTILKVDEIQTQLNAVRLSKDKAKEVRVRHIERNASKPKDITRKLPKPIIVEATINDQKVRALVDSGSLGDFISTTVVDQLKLEKDVLANPIGLQMAVTGSRSMINYSVEAQFGFQSINCTRRFDVINIDNYDLILGTPFLYQHKILMSFNPPAISVGSAAPLPIAGDEAFIIEARAAQLYETEIDKCRDEL